MSSTDLLKHIQRVRDERFDIDRIEKYSLNLLLGANIRLAIADTQEHRFVWLDDYATDASVPMLDQLKQLYEHHELLSAGFWGHITIAIENQSFSLVPRSLFDANHAEQLLSSVALCNFERQKVLYYQHNALDLVNIFAIDNDLHDFFLKAHPSRNLSFLHVTSSLIEGVFQIPAVLEARSLFVYTENKNIVILAFEGKKLLLCNQFCFVNEDDFTYYVMLVADELRINPDTDKLMLWGELTLSSAIYEKLYKYFRNVEFGMRPAQFRFGYQFDEVFDHRYFALYCLSYCE